jgi:hypothetical protein
MWCCRWVVGIDYCNYENGLQPVFLLWLLYVAAAISIGAKKLSPFSEK